MLDKKGIYALLDKNQINYETYEHPAVYTMAELDALNLPRQGNIVKNLFLCDDRKENYYLVTVPGHKKIDLIILRNRLDSRRLSLAGEDSLKEFLMLERGQVSLLGVLNNKKRNVTVIFDKSLQNQQIGIHPVENTATIFISVKDIIKLIRDNGNAVMMCEFD